MTHWLLLVEAKSIILVNPLASTIDKCVYNCFVTEISFILRDKLSKKNCFVIDKQFIMMSHIK